MSNFWKGAIVPEFVKHRDFEHSSFFAHEMDNGGDYEVDTVPVPLDIDPIDASLLDPSRDYYMIEFALHDGSIYRYWVPAEPDGSPPNLRKIASQIDEFARNPVPGGRDWFDYIDFEELFERYPSGLGDTIIGRALADRQSQFNTTFTDPLRDFEIAQDRPSKPSRRVGESRPQFSVDDI